LLARRIEPGSDGDSEISFRVANQSPSLAASRHSRVSSRRISASRMSGVPDDVLALTTRLVDDLVQSLHRAQDDSDRVRERFERDVMRERANYEKELVRQLYYEWQLAKGRTERALLEQKLDFVFTRSHPVQTNAPLASVLSASGWETPMAGGQTGNEPMGFRDSPTHEPSHHQIQTLW